ncbi:uncharacterized protein LOC133288201 [Gastrolobium bilobum]|uniref:uncharacterized protein LOC133288201 n=1 Tax=Gastrolobium bilobum TaxID=150636 RepID=UPI002AB05857|nr:uncharacterized protein LOC133288201 [Gastrolobium bilobum]
MASSNHNYLNCSTRRGYSKSQMCLFKILHIISSIPPSKEEVFPSNNKGVGIDLNLRFCSVSESGGDSEAEVVREKSVEVSKVYDNGADHEESEFEEDGDGNGGVKETMSFRGRGDDSNYLDLLIEAARVLSAKDESNSEEERELSGELGTRGASQESGLLDLEEERRVKKRKERWVVVDLYGDVVEGREPVVRSKRGRNQALPYRFRDSVVEPLKRLGRSQRPSSTVQARKRLLRTSPTT